MKAPFNPREMCIVTAREQTSAKHLSTRLCCAILCAGVVKLADALDSKSCGVKSVSVRVRPPAPTSKSSPVRGCFSFVHTVDAAGVEKRAQMKKSQCAARLLLRVPNGGARSACSTVQAPRPAPCLHERGHKKKDQTAPSAQGVFASAHRGRTLCVLHRITHTTDAAGAECLAGCVVRAEGG